MNITEIPVKGYETVLQCDDKRSGLQAIISIHNTTLGPALGGTRMWPYHSLAEAFSDANRLAKGMTYKAAVANVKHGGGKAVILGQPRTDKTEERLRAMGRFIHTLGGEYVTGEDVGTTVDDMVIIQQETPYVAGLPRDMGSSGDPSPFTALGVFLGIKTCVKWVHQSDSLRGLRIAVQGCGNVASYLCWHLHHAGAKLMVTDVVPEKAHWLAQQYDAQVIDPETIYDVPCDVYAPCALGGTLNDHTSPRLQCHIVAGSANNQCLRLEHSDVLRQRGIVYAPDFVINAGGLLNIAAERAPGGYNEARIYAQVRNIACTLQQILSTAQRQDISTQRAAIELARCKLAEGGSGRLEAVSSAAEI
jgi:leucine dehydrogenase